MSMRKRLSVSSSRSDSSFVFSTTPNAESEEWVAAWRSVQAKGMCSTATCPQRSVTMELDIIDSPVVTVDAETSVEDACEVSACFTLRSAG